MIVFHIYYIIHIYVVYPRLRQQPATGPGLGPKVFYFRVPDPLKSVLWGSKIHQVGIQNQEKSTKLGSKIHQVGLQNQEKSVLGGLWRGLGAILAHLGPQDPPKTKIYPQNQFLGALLGTHFGGQKPPKINFLGFQEVLIF